MPCSSKKQLWPELCFAILALLFPCIIHANGKIESQQITSHVMAPTSAPIQKEIIVYLPENYANSTQKYPVVYFLHSGWQLGLTPRIFLGEGYRGQLKEAHIPKIADQLIQKGYIRPMIIVMPDLSLAKPVSQANGIPMINDYIVREVVPFIDTRYRTSRTRTGRSVTGHAEGADGALFIAFSNPHLFSTAGSYAGSGLSSIGSEIEQLLAGHQQIGLPTRFWIYVGRKSPFENLEPTRQLVELLRTLGIPHIYIEDDGDHTSSIAKRIAESLMNFSEEFEQNATDANPKPKK